MKGSLKLLTVRGIPIRLHWSFLALLFLFSGVGGLSGGLKSGLHTMLFIIFLFTLVVLHELSHSFMAQRYGMTVREIVLLPVGGMAMMERIPEEPGKEASIAIAGPLFNFVAAGILYLFMLFLPGVTFDPYSQANNDTLFTSITVAMFQANLVLGLFNIIPAFPMDGGRLLRAGLVKSGMTYVRATMVAANVSRVLLAIMFAVGLYNMNPFLVIIPLVLYTAVAGEENAVRGRGAIKSLLVRNLFPQDIVSIPDRMKLGDMASLLVSSAQRHFPVMKGTRVVGILSLSDIRRELAKPGGADITVASAMHRTVVVPPEMPLTEVQKTLEAQGLPAAVAASRGRLLGVVSIDMLARLAAMLDHGTE